MEKYCCHIDVDGEGIGAAKDCKENPSTSCVLRPEAVLERTKQKATQAIWLSLSLLQLIQEPCSGRSSRGSCRSSVPSVSLGLPYSDSSSKGPSKSAEFVVHLIKCDYKSVSKFYLTPKHDVCFHSKSQTSHVQRSSD